MRWTSPEVICSHLTSSRHEIGTRIVVIYYKFSQGTAFYRVNRKNINAMLELNFKFIQSQKAPKEHDNVKDEKNKGKKKKVEHDKAYIQHHT